MNLETLDIISSLLEKSIIEKKDIRDILEGRNSDLLTELEKWSEISEECKDDLEKINAMRRRLCEIIVNKYSEFYFKMPIESVIATKNSDKIKCFFQNLAQRLNLGEMFEAEINSYLEEIAEKLNRRFTFDSMSLIRLIEASKGSNIILEEDRTRRSRRHPRQILGQNQDGTFKLEESRDLRIYTSGGSIQSGNAEASSILLSSYPDLKKEEHAGLSIGEVINPNSSSSIMQEIMKNLFDNLDLCRATYEAFYTKNGRGVTNHVTLADGSSFDFDYIINPRNLPHLLGIPRAQALSEDTIRYLEINRYDNASTVLKALIRKRDNIISDGGIMEKNGKLYQIFPWEKMILKTSSFMRGDFFKTCFCLVELGRENSISNENESYVSIAPTRYATSFTNGSVNHAEVLSDLINTFRQSKDFIFRAFIDQYDGSSMIHIPDSIRTGKAEDIIIHRSKERIKTLDFYRGQLSSSVGGAQIVRSIENNVIGQRAFTISEQVIAHFSVCQGIGIPAQLSREAVEFERTLAEEIKRYLDIDIEKLLIQPEENKITR